MIRFLNPILLYFLLQALLGCAGYELVQNDHLFSKQNISSVKVPLFINRTIFPNISAAFTNELIARLHNFKGLSIDGGDPSSLGDHALVGVLTSSAMEKSVLEPLIRSFTGNSSSLRRSIGARPDFYLTSQYRVKLNLELILIKNPLINGIVQKEKPEVIFHHSIPVEFKVVNNISAVDGPDSLGVTNYTNNRGFFEFELKKTAKKTAERLESLILL
jgi:hypothetical protein